MNKNEVLKKIGKSIMRGQTVGIYPDGSSNYYACDVENFLRPKNKRFFD